MKNLKWLIIYWIVQLNCVLVENKEYLWYVHFRRVLRLMNILLRLWSSFYRLPLIEWVSIRFDSTLWWSFCIVWKSSEEEATQFISREIQRDALSENIQLWEMSFYSDVQVQKGNFYLWHKHSAWSTTGRRFLIGIFEWHSLTHTNQSSIENAKHHNAAGTTHEKTVLEIAAEQIRIIKETIVSILFEIC